MLPEAKGKIMHQLQLSDGGSSWSKFWVLLLAAGLLAGFGTTAALFGYDYFLFLNLGAFICPFLLWRRLQDLPQGRLEGNPLQVIKFAFARALHGTVLETPEVSISDKMLGVGQEFTISYQQRFKQPVHLSLFTVALVFREELRQGDQGDTIERMVKTYDRVHQEIAGEFFYDQRSFSIPEDGAPSFTNQLKGTGMHSGKWLLRMRMEAAELPAFINEYEVFVGFEGASQVPRLLEKKTRWFGIYYELVK